MSHFSLLPIDIWAELSLFLKGRYIVRLILTGDSRLAAKIRHGVAIMKFDFRSGSSFPYPVLELLNLESLAIEPKENYDSYPMEINRTLLGPIQSPKLRELNLGMLQSFDLAFGALLNGISFPCLDTLICRNYYESISLNHLQKVPRSVTKLVLCGGLSSSSTNVVSCSEFVKALPPAIVHLELVRLNVEAADPADQIKWPISITYLKNSGSMPFGASLANLPPHLTYLSVNLSCNAHFKSISVADLPYSLKECSIGCFGYQEVPPFLLDRPMSPMMEHFHCPSIFPDHNFNWSLLSPNLSTFMYPQNISPSPQIMMDHIFKSMPKLRQATINVLHLLPERRQLPTELSSLIIMGPVSLSAFSKMILPDTIRELALAINTHPTSQPTQWNAEPWTPGDSPFSGFPPNLSSLMLKRSPHCQAAYFPRPSMWLSLPKRLVRLGISLHALSDPTCLDMFPSSLTQLSITVGDVLSHHPSENHLNWQENFTLGDHWPRNLTHLDIQSHQHGYPWTHWLKNLAERTPKLIQLTHSVPYPLTGEEYHRNLEKDAELNLDPVTVFRNLPPSLRTLILSINYRGILNDDWLKFLPRKLAVLELTTPGVALCVDDSHLRHLPPHLTNLHLSEVSGLTPAFYTSLPPLIMRIKVYIVPSPQPSQLEHFHAQYYENPCWQGLGTILLPFP